MVRLTAVRWSICLIAILAAVGLFASQAAWAKAEGNANFFLGLKALDDDWEPVEEQGAFGVELSLGRDTWPVMIAVDLFLSGAEEDEGIFDLTGATSELALGVRKIWDVGDVHPYIGGGPSLLTGALEVEVSGAGDVDDDDTTLGLWAGGGVFWRLGSRFNLGVALRYSAGDVTLFGEDFPAGGLQGGVLLGWGWPATP